MIKNIKIFAAFFLFVSMFLPLSRCSQFTTNSINIEPIPEHDKGMKSDTLKQEIQSIDESKEKNYSYTYSYSNFDIKDYKSWLLIISFLWPIPFLFYNRYGNKLLIKTFIRILEPVLCIGASFIIYTASLFSEIIYGSFIAFFSLSLYFILSSIDIIIRIKFYFRKQN